MSISSIPKTNEPFELPLELLSVVIFYAYLKDIISDILVSFDEMIILGLSCVVHLMTAYYLLCIL